MNTGNNLTEKSDPAGKVPNRKTKVFRDGLLKRLPQLGAPSWDPKAVFDVHESMMGLRDLGADSFLEPLARFAEAHGE
jgi:hypothetical protein